METLAPIRMCDPKAKLIPVPKTLTRHGSYSSLCSEVMEEKEPITVPWVLRPLFPIFFASYFLPAAHQHHTDAGKLSAAGS